MDPEIIVTENWYPTRGDAYMATFGDYDLDCFVGMGDTPSDAIVDLLDQAEG